MRLAAAVETSRDITEQVLKLARHDAAVVADRAKHAPPSSTSAPYGTRLWRSLLVTVQPMGAVHGFATPKA